MNRKTPLVTARPAVMIEALEPRIAPAGLLNETKFTSVVVGGSVLLDASGGPNQFQGLSTAFGSYAGSYLLYLNTGKALIFTTDLNGNGVLDPGEITGIALAKDSLGRAPSLTLFTDVHGDIATNLANSRPYDGTLTDSDNNPNNGRDGRILTDTPIANITLRTLTAADIDSTVAGNTVANRLALTHFSIYGNVFSGGDFGGLSIDDSGSSNLAAKFQIDINPYVYTGSQITIGSIQTGTAANNQYFHFTQASPQVLSGSSSVGSTELVSQNVEGTFRPFQIPAQEHGGDISSVSAVRAGTLFSVGLLATGDGGTGARGGNISDVTFHGDIGSYSIIAGNGGQGATGGQGGSVINFSDLSSTTGQSFIHSGSGGRGTLGAGGDGGTATFGTTNIAADLRVLLGNGGPGFTKGGTGAGITNTLFNTPDVTLPIGSKVIGTWHDIGDIGNLHPNNGGGASGVNTYSPEVIDFDGDGNGDVVYTTTNPDQVVVLFGDGEGFYNPAKTVILRVPGGATPAVTVGDFNGDGKPDIAVASGGGNNFGGIDVFINQIGSQTLNPVSADNYTRNILGDHPFSNALETAVPPANIGGYYVQGRPILALAAGDFNGDGITDIAYAERVETIGSDFQGQIVGVLLGEQATSLNTTPALVGAHTAPTFVNGSLDNGLINNTTGRPQGTGFFYSNPAPINGGSSVQIGLFFNNTSPVVLHATSAAVGNTPTAATNGLPTAPEYVVSAIQGTREVDVYTTGLPDPVTHLPAAFGLTLQQAIDLGTVDTNRNLTTPAAPQYSPQLFFVQDFTITDADQDGRADIVPMANIPQTFLEAYRGVTINGNTAFARADVGVDGTAGGDNSGIFLGNFPQLPPASIAITTVDPSQTGRFDGFAVENIVTTGIPHVEVREFRLIPVVASTTQPVVTNDVYGFDTRVVTTANYDPGLLVVDRQVNALDAFYDQVPRFSFQTNDLLTQTSHPTTNYALFAPDISDVRYDRLAFFGFDTAGLAFYRYLTQNGISIYSGNGGSSSNGAGGAAGDIGDGTLNVGNEDTTTASIQLRFTPTIEYAGEGLLLGGRGGDGFTGGGRGGNIQGVTARYNPTNTGTIGISRTTVVAGDGGNGISANGGDGGQLSALSIENGPEFDSGNGGNGLNGGKGGAILGNQSIFDTSNAFVSLLTGKGGQGSVNGGAGGDISRWQTRVEGLGGYLEYNTGAGGTGVSGVGGVGGSILDSPLANDLNYLDGDVLLATGAGGNGLGGGAGGLIRNFVNQATTQAALPSALTILAGNGGIGVAGGGGAGGSIQSVQTNASGLISLLSPAYDGLVRIIAGDGGSSYGGAGGVGGSLSNVNSTATSVPMVVAAGQGGFGLTAGGTGGTISDASFNSAAQLTGKLLIVAGKGGDAFASTGRDIDLPNDSDVTDLAHQLLAFGGASGIGGDGGSVIRVNQPVSTQTSVDVVAGNGGNTPNAGNALTATTNVGRGGSIDSVSIAGTIGSISRNNTLGQAVNPPIKSYAATAQTGNPTTSLSDFIDFLANPSFSAGFQLNDAAGNVGMVAGASGTVRGGQPASDGVNGSVSNIVASSIMSIVAGSVDRVAPVAQLSGVVVTSLDGVLGADKSPNAPYGPNGALDYYDTAGIDRANLQAGYRLIDGAVFASRIVQTPGQPISGPRVFSPQV